MAAKANKKAARAAPAKAKQVVMKPPASRGKRAAAEAKADPAARAKARVVLDLLEKRHPDAHIYLDYKTPFQLLVATILAAQCTDERVNEVTPVLFGRYPTPADLAAARLADVEKLIRSTGFFRQKAKSVIECAKVIAGQYGGEVPADLDALTKIRGIGRKTANVVLANAFGRPAIAVDTHVQRVSQRIGLATVKDPEKIEKQLCALMPQKRWTRATLLLGTHGRRICTARKPDCPHCPVNSLCNYYADALVAQPGAAS
jgi:endonuclease-3